MDNQLTQKILEELSYLRGRFDTAIPEIQASNKNVNEILLLHKEKLDNLEKEFVMVKTKVGVFGSIAGVIGGAIITIIVSVIQHFMFNSK